MLKVELTLFPGTFVERCESMVILRFGTSGMEGQSCYYLRWGRLRVEQVKGRGKLGVHLNSRFLLDIQMEISSRLLDIWAWSLKRDLSWKFQLEVARI